MFFFGLGLRRTCLETRGDGSFCSFFVVLDVREASLLIDVARLVLRVFYEGSLLGDAFRLTPEEGAFFIWGLLVIESVFDEAMY